MTQLKYRLLSAIAQAIMLPSYWIYKFNIISLLTPSCNLVCKSCIKLFAINLTEGQLSVPSSM